jgi:hypothetical protein
MNTTCKCEHEAKKEHARNCVCFSRDVSPSLRLSRPSNRIVSVVRDRHRTRGHVTIRENGAQDVMYAGNNDGTTSADDVPKRHRDPSSTVSSCVITFNITAALAAKKQLGSVDREKEGKKRPKKERERKKKRRKIRVCSSPIKLRRVCIVYTLLRYRVSRYFAESCLRR